VVTSSSKVEVAFLSSLVFVCTCEVLGVCGVLEIRGLIEAFLAFMGIVISPGTEEGLM
jgi:hypothetical protein